MLQNLISQLGHILKDQVTPALKYGNLPTLEQSQEDVMHSDIEDDRTDTQLAIDPCVVASPPSISTASTHSREESPSSASASTTVSQKGKDNKKRLCDVRDEKFLEIENKKLLLLAQNLKHDDAMPDSEELNFFKSLIPYLEKIKPIQKLKVRNKIQQVILDKLLFEDNREQSTSAQTNTFPAYPHQYSYQY
ncbi:hypothetical protein JTB14_006055 [Gonioctena quinquepunctata]|nr:hypothetical protein JTB14_006055 [Gonioctena quinquepunctata]